MERDGVPADERAGQGLANRLTDVATGVDRRLGGAVGRVVVAHHRRRLSRVARRCSLDAPAGGWAEGSPARAGSSLEVLIDGADALPRIAEELESAQSHVHLTGWHLAPEFALTRGDEPTIVRDLLADLASRIDV